MIVYYLLGCAFGAVFVEAEVISWFRIQEMFRFDAFHMFGIIGSAVVVAGLSLIAIKSFNLRDAGGCTSGHAIAGLADRQLASLFAVCGFFAGGLTTTYLILPKIL